MEKKELAQIETAKHLTRLDRSKKKLERDGKHFQDAVMCVEQWME